MVKLLLQLQKAKEYIKIWKIYWIKREVFWFSEPRGNEFSKFVHVLLDNWGKIHYIHNSCFDIDFGNCRKDQIADVRCSGSTIMR